MYTVCTTALTGWPLEPLRAGPPLPASDRLVAMLPAVQGGGAGGGGAVEQGPTAARAACKHARGSDLTQDHCLA
jgi:hypothetical protein